MTLAQLALTVAVLGALGLLAGRFGLSAIPAYLLAGLLLGPHTPVGLPVVEPTEVIGFAAELGVVFLLFFLGLEFTLARVLRSGRHFGLGGTIDLVVNAGIGFAVGVVFFGFGIAAVIVAAAVYISSSGVIIKGLTDFRRLADDETDLVLAILVFEDLAIALALPVAATGSAEALAEVALVAKAALFIGGSIAASRWLAPQIDRLLDRLPRESFVLIVLAFVAGMSAASEALGISAAIGALMAGIVLAETSVRREIEERFLGFRDLFAALFFFVFGLSIDLAAAGPVAALVALAVAASVAGKLVSGFGAGRVGGFTRRQSLNAGAALVARGEFTIILAQLASTNPALPASVRADLVAFAGFYVLATALVGVILMKESKRLGRFLFRPPKLALE